MSKGTIIGQVLVSLLLLATLPIWNAWPGHYLVVEDELAPAESILPLAGDLGRVHEAADLFHRGFGQSVLITPLPLDGQNARNRHIEQVRGILMNAGVPMEAIQVVHSAGNTTREEIAIVRQYAVENNLDSLLVVTNPWHTRRSKRIVRHAFASSGADVRVIAFDDGYDPARWWADSNHRRVTMSEYLKLLANSLGLD